MKFFKDLPLYWKILSVYVLITGILFCVVTSTQVLDIQSITITRILFLFFLVGSIFANKFLSEKYKSFILWLLAYASLGILYKDTALLNQLFFKKIDPFLMGIDNAIFGFQPSVEFSKKFNSVFWSELFFGGYFFYYLFPLIIGFYLFLKKNNEKMSNFAHTLIISFVIFYVIFIILPAEGPQFYLPFPDNFIESQGIFGKMVKIIQEGGEAPTAAFPSSHIGISFVMLHWLFNNERNLLKWFVIPVLILCFSTIYIKAHYAIDALAGIFSGITIGIIIKKWRD